jgi:hypothetical protein
MLEAAAIARTPSLGRRNESFGEKIETEALTDV